MDDDTAPETITYIHTAWVFLGLAAVCAAVSVGMAWGTEGDHKRAAGRAGSAAASEAGARTKASELADTLQALGARAQAIINGGARVGADADATRASSGGAESAATLAAQARKRSEQATRDGIAVTARAAGVQEAIAAITRQSPAPDGAMVGSIEVAAKLGVSAEKILTLPDRPMSIEETASHFERSVDDVRRAVDAVRAERGTR